MARDRVPLESWEAVVPGVVFPALALWLAGGGWSGRGVAAVANLAPLAVLALLTWFGGRRVPAVQGAATVAYGVVGAGWIGATWDVPGLASMGAHAELWTPLAAAGVAILVFGAVAVLARVGGEAGRGLAGEA
jgi:hypothetical protein